MSPGRMYYLLIIGSMKLIDKITLIIFYNEYKGTIMYKF